MKLTDATSRELDVLIKLIVHARADAEVTLEAMDEIFNGDFPGREEKVFRKETLEMFHTQLAIARMEVRKTEITNLN